MAIENDFYTLEKASEKLEVSERNIRDQIRAGKLKAYKRSGRWYILHGDIIEYLAGGETKMEKDDKPKKVKMPKTTEG